MPRKSNWNSPTTAIRIPQHCADDLMAIAKLLDQPMPDWDEFDEFVREIKRTKQEEPLKRAGIPVCKPKTDPQTIAQGIAEGWIQPKQTEIVCPLLAGFKVGDRCQAHGAIGQLVISHGPAEGDRYVAFQTDSGGNRQVFNRRLASDIQPLEESHA